jgi:hypothetical protein
LGEPKTISRRLAGYSTLYIRHADKSSTGRNK